MTDFTTPKTWSIGELVTAAMLNTHIRDNFNSVWVGLNAGDIDYYVSSVRKARLAKVTGGVLYGGASAPAYTAGAALGDILYGASANTPGWLSIGAPGSLLYSTGSGIPSWQLVSTVIKGLLHAKAEVHYDAGAQSILGTTYTNITNATVNITTTQTCTIVMHSSATLWSTDGIAYLKAVIGATSEASGYHMSFDPVATGLGWAFYATGVAAGTITCKLQGAADTAGHHGIYGVGNIVVLAYTE